jgi:hypothetical protein
MSSFRKVLAGAALALAAVTSLPAMAHDYDRGWNDRGGWGRDWDRHSDWRRVQRERADLDRAYALRERAYWSGNPWAMERADRRVAHERHELRDAWRDMRRDRW